MTGLFGPASTLPSRCRSRPRGRNKSDTTSFAHRLKLPCGNPGDPAVDVEDGLGLSLDKLDTRTSSGEKKNPVRLGGDRRRAAVALQQLHFPVKGILFESFMNPSFTLSFM